MAVFPGTYIPTGVASSAAMNHLIDDLLTPKIMSFRQICIYDEQAYLDCDGVTWHVTFGNWLEASPLKARKNGCPCPTVSNIDYSYGTFQVGAVDVGADGKPRDTVEINYNWDYFPVAVLEGYITAALSIINVTAIGPPTNYTVDTAPTNWEGVITDLAAAMCMEKLLLDYDLWKYRLVFAVGPDVVYGGGSGDITGSLETLKSNFEERANNAMQNEKFKTGNYLSPPTSIYFDAIRGGGGSAGPHGIPFLTGRLRGWKPNKWF
jgi:hypothetical protein